VTNPHLILSRLGSSRVDLHQTEITNRPAEFQSPLLTETFSIRTAGVDSWHCRFR